MLVHQKINLFWYFVGSEARSTGPQAWCWQTEQNWWGFDQDVWRTGELSGQEDHGWSELQDGGHQKLPQGQVSVYWWSPPAVSRSKSFCKWSARHSFKCLWFRAVITVVPHWLCNAYSSVGSFHHVLNDFLQFTDKLEDILDTLTSTHEMVENAEPISAHPDRIKDQLAEVKVSHPVF